jgi:hypothetical protein
MCRRARRIRSSRPGEIVQEGNIADAHGNGSATTYTFSSTFTGTGTFILSQTAKATSSRPTSSRSDRRSLSGRLLLLPAHREAAARRALVAVDAAKSGGLIHRGAEEGHSQASDSEALAVVPRSAGARRRR